MFNLFIMKLIAAGASPSAMISALRSLRDEGMESSEIEARIQLIEHTVAKASKKREAPPAEDTQPSSRNPAIEPPPAAPVEVDVVDAPPVAEESKGKKGKK